MKKRIKNRGFFKRSLIIISFQLLCISFSFFVVTASAAPEVVSNDIIDSYSFYVIIGNSNADGIISVAGLSIKISINKSRNDKNSLTELSPDRIEFGNITLTKKFSTNSVFNNWIEGMVEGNAEHYRKNIIITLLGYAGTNEGSYTIQRWRLYGCIPKSWRLSPLSMDSIDELTEHLVVACEWLEEESNL